MPPASRGSSRPAQVDPAAAVASGVEASPRRIWANDEIAEAAPPFGSDDLFELKRTTWSSDAGSLLERRRPNEALPKDDIEGKARVAEFLRVHALYTSRLQLKLKGEDTEGKYGRLCFPVEPDGGAERFAIVAIADKAESGSDDSCRKLRLVSPEEAEVRHPPTRPHARVCCRFQALCASGDLALPARVALAAERRRSDRVCNWRVQHARHPGWCDPGAEACCGC